MLPAAQSPPEGGGGTAARASRMADVVGARLCCSHVFVAPLKLSTVDTNAFRPQTGGCLPHIP